MSESPRSPQAPQRPSGARVPADETQKEKVQRQLDEALDASFPASDPVSIVTSHEEEDWGQPETQPESKS
jgi:hypothetical protein